MTSLANRSSFRVGQRADRVGQVGTCLPYGIVPSESTSVSDEGIVERKTAHELGGSPKPPAIDRTNEAGTDPARLPSQSRTREVGRSGRLETVERGRVR